MKTLVNPENDVAPIHNRCLSAVPEDMAKLIEELDEEEVE